MPEEYAIHGVTFSVDDEAEEEAAIERIGAMEKALDEVIAANEAIAQALVRYLAAQEKAAELSRYLGSEAWFEDCESDTLGLLPPDLKRGVLSEDGAFNALADNSDTAVALLEAATKALKNS